ncbi:hypothetical protein ACMD2_19320 [Ananas comosus]|uniref:Uncharacterized protein n=1 Tax=Ananas comosus TaxID=4615 RepID=A0A199VVM2_ANACO|nr:hypothetical protein ACMD2_19320 [Ananas comosus]
MLDQKKNLRTRLDVKVIPDKLQFGKSSKMLSFQLFAKGDLFGSIICPFVVRVAS